MVLSLLLGVYYYLRYKGCVLSIYIITTSTLLLVGVIAYTFSIYRG